MQNGQDFQTHFSSKNPWTRKISSVKLSVSETIDGSFTLPLEELPDLNKETEEMDRKEALSTSL